MEVLTPKLSVRGIDKSFDGKRVLKDLSFDLMEGEFLSILGASGCGKTTLLRILIGLEQADSGEIWKGGQEISGRDSADRGMGIVFQNYALFPNMTVLQNVQYALTLRRDTKKTARDIALRTLEQVGLTDQKDKKPHQLSGGQQQRVAIARALALNPEILCFDEPTSALDPELTGEVLRVIRGLKTGGNTMIVVTHEMEFARQVADVVMYMADGVIEEMGTPEQIFGNPQQEKTRAFLRNALDNTWED